MSMFVSSPFEELVAKVTNEQNVTEDWTVIMDICDKVVNYDDGSKYCLQAIGKRLHHKVPRVVIQSLVLLDACVKNCGKKFHLEVTARYFVDQIPKILSKMHETPALKLKQLIRKWSENEFREDPELGLIPSLYYQLKSQGIEFPAETEERKKVVSMDPNAVNSQEEEEDIIKAIALSLKETKQNIVYSPELEDTSRLVTSPVSLGTEKVRALYDFEAVEDNELTIKAGEIVIVVDKSNSSWWKGANHRGEGFFPANFVTDNLEVPVEESNECDEEETLPKEIDDAEEPVIINEAKIQNCLDWLNDVDPTLDLQDPNELVVLERYCYAMSPLIDEKLQELDKKCTILTTLNEELMRAIQLFYGLDSFGDSSWKSASMTLPLDQSKEMKSPTMPMGQQQQYAPQSHPPSAIDQSGHPGMTSLPVQSQGHFAPACASNGVDKLPQNAPNLCYQPVFAVVPSAKLNSQYPAMVSNVQGQPPLNKSLEESSGPLPVTTSDTINKGFVAAEFPSPGVPMMYQTLPLPQHVQNNQYSGNPLMNQVGSQVQPSSRFVLHPANSYMPSYIAQGAPDGSFAGTQPGQPMMHDMVMESKKSPLAPVPAMHSISSPPCSKSA